MPRRIAMKAPRSNYADKLNEFPHIACADQAAFGHRGEWSELFQRRIGPSFDGRIIFEVGCSDAGYLSRIAAKYPHTGFIGLDWKCKAIYDGARLVTGLGLRNVILLRGRAQEILRIFAPREIDEVWVFHPEPCARDFELKNRLIAEPFLVDLHAVLRDGGSTLSLKTDHAGYYQWVLGLFGLPEPDSFRAARQGSPSPGQRVRRSDLLPSPRIPEPNEAIRQRFRITANSADFWNDPPVVVHTSPRCFAGEATLFESRFLQKRWPIYYVEMGKKDWRADNDPAAFR